MLELSDVNIASNDIEQDVEKRRFITVVSAFQNSLEQLNPELVSFRQLDELNNGFKSSEVWDQISQFKENGGISHIRTANDNMGSLLSQLPLLLILARKSTPEKFIRGLEKHVDDFTVGLRDKRNKTDEEINKLSAELENERKKIFELTDNIKTTKQETDTRISEWQKQFSEAQEARINEYHQWRNKIEADTRTEIQGLIAISKELLESSLTAFNSDIKDYLSDASEKHKAILELYELTAGDSVGAGALKNAQDEKKQADRWRWGVIIFIILAALWLGFAIYKNIGVDEDGSILWANALKSVSLTAILLFGATFCVSQSNKHRNLSEVRRWFSLKIKAIDPFLASLDALQRAEVKMKLGENLLGQVHENVDANIRGGIILNAKNLKDLAAIIISSFRGNK